MRFPFSRAVRCASSRVSLALGMVLLVLVAGCATGSRSGTGAVSSRGPWDMDALARVPAATWGVRTGLVQEIYYEGEPLNGRPTRIFGYLGRPAESGAAGGRTFPGIVLVHGGGGKAFKDWAEHWARRGYVALAMDLAGNGPAGRLEDGGPDQSDAVKFRNFGPTDLRDMWTYHAVAGVIRGHSLLRSLPEVDATRTGLTGISWGGYLTCIVAGVDPRFRVAVPVYGCGFLGDNSYWKDRSIAAMDPRARALWLSEFDPGRYLSDVRCPILFLNGTTDFAYPMDSYRKSYRQVPGRLRHVSMNVNLPHGHIWSFREVDVFVDSVVRGEASVLRPGEVRVDGDRVTCRVSGPGKVGIQSASFCYTTDVGAWQQRVWTSVPAEVEGRRVSARVPGGRPLVGFLTVTDVRGVRTSGEHFEQVR